MPTNLVNDSEILQCPLRGDVPTHRIPEGANDCHCPGIDLYDCRRFEQLVSLYAPILETARTAQFWNRDTEERYRFRCCSTCSVRETEALLSLAGPDFDFKALQGIPA